MSNPARAPWFRFSLRWLLIVVAIVAVVFGVFSVSVGQALVIWLLTILLRGGLPTIVLVGAVFARGNWRAFSLGSFVACLPFAVAQGGTPDGLVPAIAAFGSQAVYILVCGGIAVAAREWLVRLEIANDL